MMFVTLLSFYITYIIVLDRSLKMEPTTEIGGRRSKRLILKRNNEKLQKQQDSLDQIQHDVSFEKGK